jgi:hypothetical protein
MEGCVANILTSLRERESRPTELDDYEYAWTHSLRVCTHMSASCGLVAHSENIEVSAIVASRMEPTQFFVKLINTTRKHRKTSRRLCRVPKRLQYSQAFRLRDFHCIMTSWHNQAEK